MLISPNHHLLFFKPMKTAGSSVEFAFLKQCGEEALCTGGIIQDECERGYVHRNNVFYEEGYEICRFQSHTWPELFYKSMRDPRPFESYKKVTMVRNPWDQLVSWYWWGVAMERFNKKTALLVSIDPEDNMKTAQQKFMNFITVMAQWTTIEEHERKVQCTPLEFISYVNEKFIDNSIDVYIPFENLKSEYKKTCKLMNIQEEELVKFKSTQRILSEHYSWYYNDVAIELVHKAFPKTIQKFGYTFEQEK